MNSVTVGRFRHDEKGVKRLFFVSLVLSCSMLSACSSKSTITVAGTSTSSSSTTSGSTTIGTNSGGSTSNTSGNTTTGGTDAGSSDTTSGTDSGTTDGTTGASSTTAGSTGNTAGQSTDGTTAGTDAGSSDTTGGNTGLTVSQSCQTVTTAELNDGGGVLHGVLPADLSGANQQLQITTSAQGQLTAFDATTGAFSFIPQNSRLADQIVYQVVDADNTIVAKHQHKWVFHPLRVMPLGDSITSGVEFFDGQVDHPEMPMRVGYRKFLYDRLSSDGYAVDYQGQGGQSAGADAGLADPENNGYPGVGIDFIRTKLFALLEEDAVDAILLHIGTNGTPYDAQEVMQILDVLDTWESAHHPVTAFVATIVPKRNTDANAIVDTFNADLRQRLQARTNDKVVLVEQNPALTLSDISEESVGLHPNAGGYQKMANVWYDALVNSTVMQRCD